MHSVHGALRRTCSFRTAGAALLLATAACVTPDAVELRLDDARHAVAARGDAPTLEDALAHVEPASTVLAVPPPADRATPDRPGFWFVRALAWSPAVRAARGEWRAFAAEATSAGAPAPLALQVVDHELGGDDELVEAIGVLDLVGLLGLGPSRAERRLASADAALALGRLQRAAWDAWLTVERARVAHLADELRVRELDRVLAEARTDLARFEILARTGRLGATAAETARAAIVELERRRSLVDEASVRSRAALAAASGVPADDPSLAGATEADLDALALPDPSGLALDELLAAHPRLVEARLAFGLAEAEVRRAAARAWPGVGLGPHLGYLDELRVGAVLRVAVPFPSSWRGLLAGAVARRDAAIDAFEDELHALTVVERQARAHLAVVTERASEVTPAATAAAHGEWSAVRAAFRVGRAEPMPWIRALERLGARATWKVDEAEAVALARLHLIEALGPAASPFAVESEVRP